MKGNRLLCLFVVWCVLLMPIYGVVAAEDVDLTVTPALLGDVDGDGAITPTDARLLLQFSTHKCVPFPGTPEYETYQIWRSRLADCADVDGDSVITTTDARLILQYYAGKITRWPVEGGLLADPPYLAVVTEREDGTVQYTAHRGTLAVLLSDMAPLQLALVNRHTQTPYTGTAIWGSTAPEIATVDQNGVVSLHQTGNARLYVQYSEFAYIELRLFVS